MRLLPTLAVCLFALDAAVAGPWIDPGDAALRHDVQVLADAGIISGPVSTWPLATGDLMEIDDANPAELSPAARQALSRLRKRLDQATVTGRPRFSGHVSAAEHPREIRTFASDPRESGEIGLGLEWTGRRFAARLRGQWVHDPDDNKDWRADGSYLGMALGNWMLAASTSERYWGPGWQSSLILSNNARPIPAFTLERNLTTPFENRWLRWIGPWDMSLLWGFLDDDREVPNARVFSLRLNFRPLDSLEVGLTGMGLWCGSGNDCGLDEIGDLVTGSGTTEEFDRLAGIDLRWSTSLFDVPLGLYTHWVGEDFGDGESRLVLPSRFLGQFGAETWGHLENLGSYRLFLEWADTECDFEVYRTITFNGGGGKPGCAYRNQRYRSGQTYRGRSYAHSFDQDSSVATLGAVLNDGDGMAGWMATLAYGKLNRRGRSLSTLALNQTEYWELEIRRQMEFWIGRLDLGLGYEHRENEVTTEEDDDLRAFIKWSFGP